MKSREKRISFSIMMLQLNCTIKGLGEPTYKSDLNKNHCLQLANFAILLTWDVFEAFCEDGWDFYLSKLGDILARRVFPQ